MKSLFINWFWTTNHKRIGILYLLFGVFAGFLSVLLSLLIRMQLAFPNNSFLGDNYQFYNMLVSMHGILMLFFVIVPISVGGFGNFFIPIMIGAPDMAFPRLNNLSFWLLPPSLLLLLISPFCDGGPGTGWTLYPPLSSTIGHANMSVDFVIVSFHIVGLSSILASINFICTIIFYKHESMYMNNLPLYVWSILVTSFLLVLALPVLAAAITMGRTCAMEYQICLLLTNNIAFWMSWLSMNRAMKESLETLWLGWRTRYIMKVGINSTQKYENIFYSVCGGISALRKSKPVSHKSTAAKCRLKMRESKVFYCTKVISMELVKCKVKPCKSEMRVIANKEKDDKLMIINLNNSNETFQQNSVYKIAENLYTQYKTKIESLKESDKALFNIQEIYISLMTWQQIINCQEIIRENSIYFLICRPSFLLFAVSKLKERGVKRDGLNMNSVTIGTIKRISNDLIKGIYKVKPAKRVYIPKLNGGKRPLGIPSTRDKIIQMAILLCIEPIFDKKFSKYSFGFRKGLDCHSCLLHMRRYWKNVKWFVDFDFKSAFDNIPHDIIISGIKKHMRDRRLIRLIIKLLKAGYINLYNFKDADLDQKLGIPQGSILGPLFSNIAFDNVDTIFQSFIKEHLPTVDGKSIRKHLRSIRIIDAQKKNIPYYADNKTIIHYVRYADDILIGVKGDKSLAFKALQNILHICDTVLSMKCNPEKVGIKHHSEGTLFLGYKIYGLYQLKHNIKNNQRIKSNTLKFSIPKVKILDKLKQKGFFMISKKGKNKKLVARRMDKWIFLDEYDIINRFNSVVRGLINYYSGSDRISILYEIIYMLKRSAALTLAHRKNKVSAAEGFQLYGDDLTVFNNKTNKQVSFFFPKFTGKAGFFKDGKSIQDWSFLWNSINLKGNRFPKTFNSLQKASNLPCSIPNCKNVSTDWHHLKHRKKYKSKEIDIAYSAKQIPVCKLHHRLIHNGKYSGKSLRSLEAYDSRDFND